MEQSPGDFHRAIFILTTVVCSKIVSIFWHEQIDSERFSDFLKIAQKQGAWVSRDLTKGERRDRELYFWAPLTYQGLCQALCVYYLT